MPISKKPKRQKSKVIASEVLLKALGGQKMRAEMINTRERFGEVDFNIGLPPCDDPNGKYQC
jgi:hypothetical protein